MCDGECDIVYPLVSMYAFDLQVIQSDSLHDIDAFYLLPQN